MTADAVSERITPRTRAIVLNSPSNPTGGVNRPEDVRGIVDLAKDHDLWIISDEIYRKILYEGKHLSPASLPGAFERTFTVATPAGEVTVLADRLEEILVFSQEVLDLVGEFDAILATGHVTWKEHLAVTRAFGERGKVVVTHALEELAGPNLSVEQCIELADLGINTDKDRRVDEDGPEDLNRDGVISQIGTDLDRNGHHVLDGAGNPWLLGMATTLRDAASSHWASSTASTTLPVADSAWTTDMNAVATER